MGHTCGDKLMAVRAIGAAIASAEAIKKFEIMEMIKLFFTSAEKDGDSKGKC